MLRRNACGRSSVGASTYEVHLEREALVKTLREDT